MTPAPAPDGRSSADAPCFVLFVALLAVLAARVAGTVHRPADVALLLLAAVAAWGAVDLVSGLVHWFCDTFFDEHTPGIGPALIAPFREHHHDPLAMTGRGFLEVNRGNYRVMIPILASVLLQDASGDRPPALYAHGFLLFAAVAVVLTNQFHKWAHAPCVPRPIGWLQHVGLAIAPARHARHHGASTRIAFCVTTGWWNPVLDRLRLFDRLEGAISACARRPQSGLRPR